MHDAVPKLATRSRTALGAQQRGHDIAVDVHDIGGAPAARRIAALSLTHTRTQSTNADPKKIHHNEIYALYLSNRSMSSTADASSSASSIAWSCVIRACDHA